MATPEWGAKKRLSACHSKCSHGKYSHGKHSHTNYSQWGAKKRLSWAPCRTCHGYAYLVPLRKALVHVLRLHAVLQLEDDDANPLHRVTCHALKRAHRRRLRRRRRRTAAFAFAFAVAAVAAKAFAASASASAFASAFAFAFAFAFAAFAAFAARRCPPRELSRLLSEQVVARREPRCRACGRVGCVERLAEHKTAEGAPSKQSHSQGG